MKPKTEPKFTKGPLSSKAHLYRVLRFDGRTVAAFNSQEVSVVISEDERKANCLLIASAPSLYTALELALKREENRLSAVDGTNFDEQTLAELDDARNAIAIYSAALDRAVGKGGV